MTSWVPMEDHHTYALLLSLASPHCRRLGNFGAVPLAPGWYIYTGSAKRNLPHRLGRHFRRNKPIRWHIDRLTTARQMRIVGAVTLGGEWSECRLGAWLRETLSLTVPLPGFGASDCREGCGAHLYYSAMPLPPEELAQRLTTGQALLRGYGGKLVIVGPQ